MLLGRPDAHISAVTTVADPDGQRAGFAKHLLRLLGRDDIPVASGAGASGTTGFAAGDLTRADRYWGGPVDRLLSPRDGALRLLESSVGVGATVVAIGPCTNLADFERVRPGRLGSVPVYAMGGWTRPLDADLPSWGPARDSNVQFDTAAAAALLQCSRVTWVPIEVTSRTHLRTGDLPRLRASGPVGRLLAAQAEAYAKDHDFGTLGRTFAGLPTDLTTFLHDPLTCAVALGWKGARVQPISLLPVLEGDVLRFERSPDGRPARLVTDVDGPAFVEHLLTAIERAQARFA
jgi:inosine-uridine nucleoside N-ribohydrolase